MEEGEEDGVEEEDEDWEDEEDDAARLLRQAPRLLLHRLQSLPLRQRVAKGSKTTTKTQLRP